MKAELHESWDQHQWDLRDARVTQLHIGPDGVRITTWHLDGSAEFRLGCPFRYVGADGTEHQIDPEEPEQLAPLLGLISRLLERVTVLRSGSLTLAFGDGSLIHIDPHPRFEAWEARGQGTLDELGYLCGPGGGSPWG